MVRAILVKTSLILLAFNFLYCKKQSGEKAADISGVWQAVAFGYVDGNGQKKWEPEHVSNPPVLTFNSAGKGVLDARFDRRIYYQVRSESRMDLYDTLGNLQQLSYDLSKSNLTIQGDCNSFCGEQFVR